MPTKEFVHPECDRIYIKGCEEKGIEEFYIGYDVMKDMVLDAAFADCNYNPATLTITYRINKILFYKLIGIWDYALKYCPNRRVRHLMEYGKNYKVKLKNFYRAMNLIAELIYEGE